MSKDSPDTDDMRPSYDFSNAVQGKYAKRFAEGSNVVILSPDIAEAFPDSDAVNQALRELLEQRRGKESA